MFGLLLSFDEVWAWLVLMLFLYNKMIKEEDLKERYAGQLYDKYEILDIIGSGTFGKVYLVQSFLC